jgi:hypothetical protein
MRARWVVIALATLTAVACAPGTTDLGFSPTLSRPVGQSPSGWRPQLVPSPDGGVVSTQNSARPLTRVRADGVVDEQWGAELPDECARIDRAVASGTTILVSCQHAGPTGPLAWQLWRVTETGRLDAAFGGGDGIADVPAELAEFDVAPLPGGGALGLGRESLPLSTTSVAPLVAIVYSPEGTVTRTTELAIPLPLPLVPGGFEGWQIDARVVPTSTGVVALEALSLVPDGAVFVNVWRLQHFDATGAVVDDLAFTNSASSGNNVGSDDFADHVGLSDGRTALALRRHTIDITTGASNSFALLIVLGADGSPDPGFGSSGRLLLTGRAGGDLFPSALLATNGNRYLVVAGSFGDALLQRYDARTGARDLTFGESGNAGVVLRSVDALAARSRDHEQVYIGGIDHQGRPAVARIWNGVVS